MTQNSTPPQQGREPELAYVGSWVEQSDLNQQSGSGCMNSDSSGSASDRSMSKPALTKSSAILTVQQATRVHYVPKKPIKMDSTARTTSVARNTLRWRDTSLRQCMKTLGSQEKDCEMPIPPTLEPRRLRECKQPISKFEQTLGLFAFKLGHFSFS